MRLLPLLLLLAASPATAAEPPELPPAPAPDEAPPATAPPPPEAATPPAEATPPAPLPRLGMRLAAGLPEGAALSLVFRPTRGLRLEAGPAWNYLGWGAQLGLGFQPFHGVISPVLDLGYGRFFEADASARFPDAPPEVQPLIQHLGYDYLAGLLSIEMGSTHGLSFSIGAGISYFWTTIHQSVTVTQNAGTAQETTVTFDHPSFRAVVPTLKVGMLYYF